MTLLKETDLSLEAGTVIYVEKKRKNGWWICVANGRRGMVPHNYLKKVDNEQKAMQEE